MKRYLIKDNEGWLSRSVFENVEEAEKRINALFHEENWKSVISMNIYKIDPEEGWIDEVKTVYRHETNQMCISESETAEAWHELGNAYIEAMEERGESL